MKITKTIKKAILTVVATLTALCTIGITNSYAKTASTGNELLLGLEQYRTSGYSYKWGDKIAWKISSYSGATVNKDRTFYCIKGGPGFGSSVMGESGITQRTYSEYFDLKDYNSIDSTYQQVLPTGEKYNSLVYLLEHIYVAPQLKTGETLTQEQQELREEFLGTYIRNADYSQLTDDEIDIAQQLAVWYFTNDDEYKVTTTDSSGNTVPGSFTLSIKNSTDTAYASLGNYFGYDGDDRNDAAVELFKNLVKDAEANKNTAPSTDTNPVTFTYAGAKRVTSGSNYVLGPFKITENNSTDIYTLQLLVKASSQSDAANISYTLLDSNKNTTTKTLAQLVGQEFYLSIPTTQNLDTAKIVLNVGKTQTNITYWSVSGANAIDQPIVEVTTENKNYPVEVDVPQDYVFDLALRKFITKINDVDVQTSREPVVSATTITNLRNETITTTTKEHTKNPLVVSNGSKVLYTIRIYNEGNMNGYATEVTDYLPSGLTLTTGSTINTTYGWTNPSGDGKTIVTSYLKDKLIGKFDGTTLNYVDLQIECTVTATATTSEQHLKNVAEITDDADENGNEVADRDSTPDNLTNNQIQNYNPGESEKGWGYEDDDDYEDLVLPGSTFDLALRKFITKINDVAVETSREPVISTATITNLRNEAITTTTKEHTKTPLTVATGDKVLYTIRIYNEGELDGYATEVTDYLPSGLTLTTGSTINATYGWTNPSGDGKTIVTTYLKDKLIGKFDGTTVKYVDLQVECTVTATATTSEQHLKNVAEITDDADENGNPITDRDSTPDDLTNNQIQNYNPGESERGWGYEDDDDYEDLVMPGSTFDLALRKFITNINGVELVDSTGKYQREPEIDLTPLQNGTDTTAIYKHRKDPVGVAVGDIVIYTIRVYNEGDLDGYASSVTDYLPPQLEFVIDDEENFNASYGWIVDSSLRKATTTNLSKEYDEDNLIKGFDGTTLDYKELKVKCRVKSTTDLDKVITNIAEITDFTDKNGNDITDRDSQQNNLVLPSDEDLPDYKGNDSNKSVLTDEDYFYKGQQDDDDFDKLILQEFDLALRKFITKVNDDAVTNRIPVFTKVKDENGNYIYEHTKDPVLVETTDVVEYTIRIYNEGDIDGYAKEVTDDIPSGLQFLPDNETNQEYRWVMYKEDGTQTLDVTQAKYISTDYLSKEQADLTGRDNLLKAFDQETMESPDYRDVKVAFKVVAPNSYSEIITNIAEITDDSDENGDDIPDRDSTPDNGDEDEDDIDKEHVKLQYFDLALRKFITAVDDTPVTDRVPVFKIDENGNYVYEHTKEPVEVENGNIVTYTLRIFNEGTKDGYAKEIKDDLPEGLLFLPENEINVEYRWVMLDAQGNETDNVEEAVSIKTDYLSKEQEDATGRDNLLVAFDETTMEQPDYRDIKIAFKVTEPNTSDRILINQAQISDDSDKDGNDVVDKDSTPDEWIDGEDDQDIEKVKVKYFDLALRKWVTQAIVIEDGKETVTESGHTAEDDPEDPVKVEIVASKLNKVVVKFRYKIRVTNEGEIAGYVKEISDYIPEGLRFVAADNPQWKEADGKITTDQLKDTLLQPGESAEVEVLLTWINSKDNMGLKVNVAEISKDYNESNTPDIDSTPDNKKEGEDDIDDAPVILSVKTGIETMAIGTIAIITACLAIVVTGTVLIKKYIL